MKIPHKWSKEIKAWADGEDIQVRYLTTSGLWSDWHNGCNAGNATWYDLTTYEYRVKPKPDVSDNYKLTRNSDGLALFLRGSAQWLQELGSLNFTFDGETGKLKSVEML